MIDTISMTAIREKAHRNRPTHGRLYCLSSTVDHSRSMYSIVKITTDTARPVASQPSAAFQCDWHAAHTAVPDLPPSQVSKNVGLALYQLLIVENANLK